MARKSSSRSIRKSNGPAAPLTEVQLKRKIKARPALIKPGKIKLHVDMMVSGTPKLRHKMARLSKSLIARPHAKVRSGRGHKLELEIAGAELGTRVFRPAITGKRIPLPKITAKMRREAQLGLPALSGYLPDHLPLQPSPPQLDKALRVKPFINALSRSKTERRATTVFQPEDRYTFSDTAFPWCTVGRVDTAGGWASGALVGPRHLLTCSHAMVWGSGNSAGWVRFRPSYFDGNAPFGEAWATRWYAFRKVTGPTINAAEAREDYVVLVLDRRIGDTCGWMGSRTYSESWDGGTYWRHIGYPGDMAGGQRPSYERDIALDGRNSSTHRAVWHQGDVWPGQSGGPFFAWWSGESWPRAVCVQSWQNNQRNGASGGSRLVDLIIRARNEFP